jgi:hypothetical protein
MSLYIGCDNLVEWEYPEDEVTGASIGSDATGTVTVKDSAGAEVTGAIDLSATYAAGPPTRYYATIPNTVDLTEGSTYYVEFTLTASGGTPHGFRREAHAAVYAT